MAANSNRLGAIIQNLSDYELNLKYGTGAAASDGNISVVIPSNGYWEMPNPIFVSAITGFWNGDDDLFALVTDLSE